MDNFLKAMEFPKLLETLAQDCQTPEGKLFLKTFYPLDDEAILQNRLEKTQELEQHLVKHSTPPIPRSEDFRLSFETSRRVGRVLSALELTALLQFLQDVIKLRQYLSILEKPPVVFEQWLERLQWLPALKELLQRKVSDRGEILDGASAELKSIRDRLRSLKAEVQNYYQRFLQRHENEDALQEKIVTEREGRLVVPVKRDHQNQIPGFVHGLSASGSTLFVEPEEIAGRNNQVRETLEQEDVEIRKVLRECTEAVLSVAPELEETLKACAEIDAHGVLAQFASRFDGQFLKPQKGSALLLKAARHPLLALEAREKYREKVIPLELEFLNEVSVVLLSGPNAGGKTVALKTLGLTCAMAQAGLPVLTGGASAFPWLTHFDTDLMDDQSLQDHLSTYAAKLTALKRMLDHSGPQTLFLLDELGAGTDPREGGALGLSCLESFREKGVFVLANTHQPLLKLLTQEEKGMANAAMLFDEQTGKPTFRLVLGIPGRSYALTLATQMGFDPAVLERAKAHLPEGEADLSELLAKLGGEKQRMEEARMEAEKSLNRVKKMEEELLIARRQIKEEARRVKREAQVEAEGIVKNTRRQMEHLIQGVKPPLGSEVNRDKVKTAQQEVRHKLQTIPRIPSKVLTEVQSLQPGDRLFFKPGNFDGKVVTADDDKQEAVIQLEGGLKLSCKYSDLGVMTKTNSSPRPLIQPSSVMPDGSSDGKGQLELDLRGKKVDQALALLDKYLDDALLVNLPFVRIIHGKGTGALKEAIHKHLPASHPRVEFSMAEPAQGGAGVTVIKFKS
jgi:DNA mismatch repair protein MutS2